MFGNGVGAGAADLAEKEARESGLPFDDSLLFVVHVQEIELSRAVRKSEGEMLQKAAHDRFAEGVEEENEAGAFGNPGLEDIAAGDLHRSRGATGGTPSADVLPGHTGEDGIEFDSLYLCKRMLGREEHGAAHSGADVDEAEVFNRSAGSGPLPTLEKGVEDGRGDAEVRGGVAVVSVTSFEKAARDKAAGLDAVFEVEGMRRETLLFCEAGQRRLSSSSRKLRFHCGHEGTLAHGANEIVDNGFSAMQESVLNNSPLPAD